jgi:hypothetical protein
VFRGISEIVIAFELRRAQHPPGQEKKTPRPQ